MTLLKVSCTALLLLLVPQAGSTQAATCHYVGDLILKPVWDDPVLGKSGVNDPGDYEMQLQADFGYEDCSSANYTVKSGTVVNGASIPRAAWTLLGYTPWTGPVQKPSVVHDDMCGRVVLTSKLVHNLFHEGLLIAGATPFRAALMYAAVSNFGPQWSTPGGPVTYPTYSEVVMNLIKRMLTGGERIATRTVTDTTGSPTRPGTLKTFSLERRDVTLDGSARDISIVDAISSEVKELPASILLDLDAKGRVEMRVQ